VERPTPVEELDERGGRHPMRDHGAKARAWVARLLIAIVLVVVITMIVIGATQLDLGAR
jgi:hypothetical protein